MANQFVGRPPDERGTPLASNPAEVEAFAEDGGLVIGTPDLLQLAMMHDRGEIEAADARRLLWGCQGYFSIHSP